MWAERKVLEHTKSFPAVLSQVQKVKFDYKKLPPSSRGKYYLITSKRKPENSFEKILEVNVCERDFI